MATWLVTGANRGVGAEIARAARDGGDDVVVGARKIETLPPDLAFADHVLPVRLDVTDPASIDNAVTAAVERFGGIDVLVNNAGYGFIGALEETSDAEVRAVFDVNVFGLLAVTRAVLPRMRAAGRGTVVNIGSRGGFEGQAGVSTYGATKFAVEAVTEALDAEMRPFGIRSMVAELGNVRTDFLDASSLRTPAHRLDAYDGTPAHDRLAAAGGANHLQPGDPARVAALIHRVVSGAEPPVRLPVGRDTVERLGVKIDQLRDDRDRWRTEAAATAHEDA